MQTNPAVEQNKNTKWSENSANNGDYAVQGHQFGYQWEALMLLPSVNNSKTTYLAPLPRSGRLLVQFSLLWTGRGWLSLTHLLGWTPTLLGMRKVGLKKLCYKAYVDILNHLGVTDWYDRRTYRLTDSVFCASVRYVARPKLTTQMWVSKVSKNISKAQEVNVSQCAE